MIVLAIRTDKPEAEIYLFKDGNKLDEIKWHAHRQLAETLHDKIDKLLTLQGLTLQDLINGGRVAVYRGPGSFTGLRIGVSVANALAYGLNIPVVSGSGEDWLIGCLSEDSRSFAPISPYYGAEPHITMQKK